MHGAPPLDLRPAADEVAHLVVGIDDGQLADPTPCDDYLVATLLDHLLGLSVAFRTAALGGPDLAPSGPQPRADALPGDWRDALPAALDALVAAWRAPSAWRGEASAGGVTMPAAVMGRVVLDELVLHGWDLARATGQPFRCHPDHVREVLAFTEAAARPGTADRGLFGPPVPVPDDADPFVRALGFAGRDPGWSRRRRDR